LGNRTAGKEKWPQRLDSGRRGAGGGEGVTRKETRKRAGFSEKKKKTGREDKKDGEVGIKGPPQQKGSWGGRGGCK